MALKSQKAKIELGFTSLDLPIQPEVIEFEVEGLPEVPLTEDDMRAARRKVIEEAQKALDLRLAEIIASEPRAEERPEPGAQ